MTGRATWPDKWALSSSSDDWSRFEVEIMGWGRILRCEDLSDTPQLNAALLVAAPQLRRALVDLRLEALHYLNTGRAPELLRGAVDRAAALLVDISIMAGDDPPGGDPCEGCGSVSDVHLARCPAVCGHEWPAEIHEEGGAHHCLKCGADGLA